MKQNKVPNLKQVPTISGRVKFVAFAALFLLAYAAPAFAAPSPLTLSRALIEAYQKNPDLEAARAELRSVDELYAQAVAGFKPTVNGVADYTGSYKELHGGGTSTNDPKTLSVQLTQPLYSGGSTLANVEGANNKIMAARAKLLVVEQEVLLEAVRAYMNMIRDKRIVELNVNNEAVLQSHLKASQERYRLGDITRTDVSQAESRLAKTSAARIAAEGELKKSHAIFEQVIGLSPLDLQKPSAGLALPASESEAIDMAVKKNPSVIYARYTENAGRNSTRSIQGEHMPQVNLTGVVGKIYDPADTSAHSENTGSIGIRATVPFYSAGVTSSRVRQSRQIENQLRMETQAAERTARQTVVDAWESFKAATAETRALQTQIAAAKLALEGVKVESEFGSRTILDLLDAEQEYLDAQVKQVSAETDRISAAYGILAAVGNLTAENLTLKVKIYDAAKNFQNINKPFFQPQTSVFRGDFRNIK